MPTPELTPPLGTPVRGLSDVLRMVKDIAREVSAPFEDLGFGQIDQGGEGKRLSTEPLPRLQCFQIQGCWESVNPPPKHGASKGLFWKTCAVPVQHWSEQPLTSYESYWATVNDEQYCTGSDQTNEGQTWIFWAVGPPACAIDNTQANCENDDAWQDVLYPLYGVGQWVWCVWDYAANVWRVLHTYDPIIQFKLTEPMYGCTSACAQVLGFECSPTCSTGSESPSSSSSEPSSSSESPSESESPSVSESPSESPSYSSSSACGGGFSFSIDESSSSEGTTESSSSEASSSSSEEEADCCSTYFSRGLVRVYDDIGIVNTAYPDTCIAPACATGWAKRCADSGRWHVISYGQCECGNCESVSSSSSYSSNSESPSESPSLSLPSASSLSYSESEGSSSSPSSSSYSSSSYCDSVRLVKDVCCAPEGQSIIVKYCTIYLPPGAYCDCESDCESSSS